MKPLLAIACACALMSACFAGRHRSNGGGVYSDRDRAEAIALIQDDTGKVSFIGEGDIEPVARSVHLVRQHFPDGHDIRVQDGSRIEIRLADSATHLLLSHLPRGWQGDSAVTSLHLPSLDSLNTALGASIVRVTVVSLSAIPTLFVTPIFSRPLYRAAAANHYNALPEVSAAIYGLTGGSGSSLSLTRNGSLHTFLFRRKWDDVHSHSWVFEVDLVTQQVRRVRDYGDPWPVRPAA